MSDRFFTTSTTYPAIIGDITQRDLAMRERETLRRRIEDEAWRTGNTHVRVVDHLGRTVDAWPIDVRRFVVREGQRVVFPSRSAVDGTRLGTVLCVCGSRARVRYRFKHGGESEKWVSLRACRPAQ